MKKIRGKTNVNYESKISKITNSQPFLTQHRLIYTTGKENWHIQKIAPTYIYI